MADAPGPDGLFREAPEPVRRYFRAKRSVPSFDWRDIAPAEHAVLFTVAKTAGYDVLGDLRHAVDDAIVNRRPFEEFKQELEPILRAKGWWGKADVLDPLTEEIVTVELGSPRRLRTIYWANIFAAHASGEWERIQANKRVLPFLRYVRTTAEEPRQEHLEWVDVILLVDDPWWDTHFPPNGWGCECATEQLTRFRAMKLGYDPAKLAPDLKLRPWTNRRTGETVDVPAGIDPGWHGNPGKTRAKTAADLAAGRIDAMPAAAQDAAVADLVHGRLPTAIHDGVVPYERGSTAPDNRERGRIATPVAALPAALAEAIGAGTQVVRYSVADAAKMLASHPEVTVDDIARLHRAARDLATEVIVEEGGRQAHLLWADDGGFWRALLRLTLTGAEIYLKTLHRYDSRPNYRDRLKRRERSKE